MPAFASSNPATQPTSQVSGRRFDLNRNPPTFPQVSARSVGLCNGKFRILWTILEFLRASLWSRISDIRILLLETRFEATDLGTSRGLVNLNAMVEQTFLLSADRKTR
jgi:hypothetical protein